MVHFIRVYFKQLFTSLVLIICFVNAKAGDTLVQAGSLWKYLDDGSNQGIAWYSPSFNDSAWSIGPAEFGFGDGDEMTIVSYGSDPNDKYITTYFRSSFNITDTSVYKGMRLYVKKDDGIVLYLNGIEIYRSNMPADTIEYSTEAVYGIGLGQEEYFILSRIEPSLFVNGTNVIAAEVHQSSNGSDDLSFDLMLIGDREAEIIRGPYLQSSTTNSIKICYRTSVPEISKVYFGTSIAYTDSVIDTAKVIDHFVQIPVVASTKYFYSVNSTYKQLAGDTSNYFYSAPDTNSRHPLRIWAMGDMGSGNLEQLATRDAYYVDSWNKYTDMVLWLGDNAYPFASDENYTQNIFTNHYEDLLKKSVVYSTAGNHELMNANTVSQTGVYFDIFSFPVNGEGGGVPSGTESYYSFNYSNVHFICLESNIDSLGLVNASYMLSWLHQDLAVNTQPWTIAYYHCPPYSKGYHDSDNDSDQTYMRKNVNPVLESYNVDLVLTGHSHSYERSYLLKGHYGNAASFDSTMIKSNLSGTPPFVYSKSSPVDSGTVYAVVGNTATLTSVQHDWPHPAMYMSLDTVLGSMVVEINGDTLHGRLLTDSGTIADHFAIVKTITTSIPESLDFNSAYSIYPQPASGELNIIAKSSKGKKQIRILNNLGQQLSEHVFSNTDHFAINIKSLTSGMYIISIKDESGIYNQRFLKN